MSTAKPTTETALLGALRQDLRNMPVEDRRFGIDLHGRLKALEGVTGHDQSPLSDAAYYTIDCTLIAIKGEDADLLEYQNHATYTQVLQLITRAHVEAIAQDEAYRRATEAEPALPPGIPPQEAEMFGYAKPTTRVFTIKLSPAAAANAAATGADPIADVGRLRAGLSAKALLAECLHGADPEYVPGWHEYVDAIVAAAQAEEARAHAAKPLDLNAEHLRNPTARELRARLFALQDQDVPLTDAEIAAALGR